jgi:hypothetical protein
MDSDLLESVVGEAVEESLIHHASGKSGEVQGQT